MITGVIIACEIGFWVLLALGMLLRYPLHRPVAGAVALACVPVVDVVLLVVTAVDLYRGAEFHTAHSLAAAYLGFSLAFGHRLVRWADVRFAHRFADGPPPVPKPAAGSSQRRQQAWSEWRRVVLAAAIASAVLGGLALVVADGQREAVLVSAAPLWIISGLWLVLGPAWEEASPAQTRSN